MLTLLLCPGAAAAAVEAAEPGDAGGAAAERGAQPAAARGPAEECDPATGCMVACGAQLTRYIPVQQLEQTILAQQSTPHNQQQQLQQRVQQILQQKQQLQQQIKQFQQQVSRYRNI